MTTIHSKYPQGMKDSEIKDAIKEYSNEISNQNASINVVMQLSPLIQLGQNELQGRQTKRASWLSVGVAFLSLAIAGVAMFVSLNTSKSSERWELSQLDILKAINNDTNNISNKLNSSNGAGDNDGALP